MAMDDTNVSVPKATAASAASGGAQAGAGMAAVDGAAKGIAAAGSHAVNGFAGMLQAAGNAISNAVGTVTNAVSGFISNAVGAVTNMVGGVASAATTMFTTIATAITVGVTAITGVGVATAPNNIAVISDAVPDDCAIIAQGSTDGSAGALGSADQCRNAYIIYHTLYNWLVNNGETNAENQAYGILANMYRECGYNPASLESGQTIGSTDYSALSAHKKGIGLVQWTNLGAELAAYFETNSLPWDALESQLRLFIDGNDPLFARTVEYAATSDEMSDTQCDIKFLTLYERPAAEYVAQRTNEAAQDIAKVRLDVQHHASTSPTGDDAIVTDLLTYAASLTGGTGEGAGLTTHQSNPNCYSIGKYDNSSIAKAAVSFAWQTSSQSYNNGTAKYIQVCNNVHGANVYYKACDRCVTAAVAWSGSDDGMATAFGVQGIYDHVSTSDKWQNIGLVQFGADGLPTNCEPGDVLLVRKEDRPGYSCGHVVIYVGNETIKEFYPNADGTANMISASLDERSAACGTFSKSADHERYTIWRCTNTEKSPTYMNAGNE